MKSVAAWLKQSRWQASVVRGAAPFDAQGKLYLPQQSDVGPLAPGALTLPAPSLALPIHFPLPVLIPGGQAKNLPKWRNLLPTPSAAGIAASAASKSATTKRQAKVQRKPVLKMTAHLCWWLLSRGF